MKIILLFIFLSISCSEATKKSEQEDNIIPSSTTKKVETKEIKIQKEEIVGEKLQFEYDVLEEIPHDINAYTQGYIFKNNILYESTGQYGSSTLRKVDPKNGQVIQKISVGFRYFEEGIEM